MTEEAKIRSVLDDAQRREIAIFCISPHSSDEIISKVRETWNSYDAKTLASDLGLLEAYEGAVYKDNKWTTTDTAKAVLKKYYGVKV